MRDSGLRWTASLLLVLVVHGSVLFTLNRLQPTANAEPAEAISIDLAPAPVAPTPAPAPPSPPPKPAAVVPPTPPAPAEHKPVVHRRAVTQARPQPPAETELPAPLSQAAATADSTEPPASAPPPPAAPTADPAPPPSGPAVTNWQGRLVAHLARFKQYPDAARLRGEQGVVLMRLTLTHDGRVVAVSMARGSGYPELDAEGQAWILRAEPYPALPPEITQSRVELTVPLRFTLQ